MEKIYIGIDPGKTGAIICLNGNKVKKFTIPLIDKFYDLQKLDEIFCTIASWTTPCHVIIESVHAVFGSAAGATFEFGYGVGILDAMVVAHGLSYTKVQPKEWQKLCFQSIPEIRKPDKVKKDLTGNIKKDKEGNEMITKGKVDTKPMALLAAKRLFPNEDLRENVRCTESHKGIVDAILIAYYGQKNNL